MKGFAPQNAEKGCLCFIERHNVRHAELPRGSSGLQLIEHVLWRRDRSGAVTNECVRSLALRAEDASRNSQNLTALLICEGSRDECAAPLTSFHHECSPCQARDDAVPAGEIYRVGLDSEGKLGNQ